MPEKSAQRATYTVDCHCGVQAVVDVAQFGRPQICRSCGLPFTVAWGADPKTRKRVPIAVAQAKTRGVRTKGVPPQKPPVGGLFLVCACGYRRAVSPEDSVRNTRCPGCGKWMIVEKPRDTKVATKPLPPPTPPPKRSAAPLKPPTPMHLARGPAGAHELKCACGGRLYVRLEDAGAQARCPACGRLMKLERFRDPQTFVTRVRGTDAAIDPSAPVRSLTMIARLAREAPGSASPAPFSAQNVACECGEQIVVDWEDVGKHFTCPSCTRTLKIEKSHSPQSMAFKIRATAVPAPPETPPPKAQAAAPPARKPAVAPPPVAPARGLSGPQDLICGCGENLVLEPADLGQRVQCPSCGIVMKVEAVHDAATGTSVLRVRAIGKVDLDSWSLDDFS